MISIITPAEELPVSLEEAKRHLRVEHDDDDELIGSQLAAACDEVEKAVRKSLAEQTLKCQVADWPTQDRRLWLPRPPLISVTSVKYLDTSNVEQTVSSGNYFTLNDSGTVVFLADFAWHALADRPDAVRVTYTAGFDALPGSLRQCILLNLSQHYFGRDEKRQAAIQALIEQHKCRHPRTLEAAAA